MLVFLSSGNYSYDEKSSSIVKCKIRLLPFPIFYKNKFEPFSLVKKLPAVKTVSPSPISIIMMPVAFMCYIFNGLYN